MICANLCSQNRAQHKWHAENEANLRKELTKEWGYLKKAWANTTDCLGMLEEAFADDSAAPPTKRPKSSTALLARYRKRLSRARQQNEELQCQLEALQVHAEEQLESRDAAISSAQAMATTWEVQCEELEILVDAVQPTLSTAETMAARSEEVSNFLPQTKDRHGVYMPRIRTMYFKMLAAGVGKARCQPLLRSLLTLAGVPGYDGAGPLAPHRQVPGKTTAKEMLAQMAALTFLRPVLFGTLSSRPNKRYRNPFANPRTLIFDHFSTGSATNESKVDYSSKSKSCNVCQIVCQKLQRLSHFCATTLCSASPNSLRY